MTEEQRKTECAKWTDMKWCGAADAATPGMCVKNTDTCCTSGQKFCWDDTNKKNYCYTPTAAQQSCPSMGNTTTACPATNPVRCADSVCYPSGTDCSKLSGTYTCANTNEVWCNDKKSCIPKGTTCTSGGTKTEEEMKTECFKNTSMKWCSATFTGGMGFCAQTTWDCKNGHPGIVQTCSEGLAYCGESPTRKAGCYKSCTEQSTECSDGKHWCPWSMSGSGGECKNNGSTCWTYSPPTCGKGYTACKSEQGGYECSLGASCPDLSKTTPEQRCKAKNVSGESRWQWCPHKGYSGAGDQGGSCADTTDKCMMPCNQQMCEARSKDKGYESMEWCSDTYKTWDGKTETNEWCNPSGCPVKKMELCKAKGREWCDMEGDMPAADMWIDPDHDRGWCAMKNESCPFNWPFKKDSCEKYNGKWCQYDKYWGECVPGSRTCEEFDFGPKKCMWGKDTSGSCSQFPNTQEKCESAEMKGYWCEQSSASFMMPMCGPQPMTTATAMMPVMPSGWCNKLPMCPNKPKDGMRVCPDGKKYAVSKLSECPSNAAIEEPAKPSCSGGKQRSSDGTCPAEKRQVEVPVKLKPEEVLTPEEQTSRESDLSSILKDLESATVELRGKRDKDGYTSAQKAVDEIKGYKQKLHTFTKANADSYREVAKILNARSAKIEKDGSVDTAQKLLEDLKVGQLNKIKLDFVDTEKFLDTLEEKIATLKEASLNVSGILESTAKESRSSLESIMSAESYSDNVQRKADALASSLSTINKRYIPTINNSFKVKNAADLLNERLNTLAEEAASLQEALSEKNYDVKANIKVINSQITKARSELAKNMKSVIGSSTLTFLRSFTESRFRDIEDELADTGSVEDLGKLLYGEDGKEDGVGGVNGQFASYAAKVASMKKAESGLKGKARSAALRERTTAETAIRRAKAPYAQLKSLEKREDTLNTKQRVSVVKTANAMNTLIDGLNSKLKLQNEASVSEELGGILEKDEIEPADVKEVKEMIQASKDISQLLGFGTSRTYLVKR